MRCGLQGGRQADKVQCVPLLYRLGCGGEPGATQADGQCSGRRDMGFDDVDHGKGQRAVHQQLAWEEELVVTTQ